MEFAGNQRTNPRWCADFVGRMQVEPFPAKLDKTLFQNFYGISVVVGVAGAAQSATSIPVAALAPPQPSTIPIQSVGSVAIPQGTYLNFGGAKLAYVTVDAKYGDTAITVAALPTALVQNDTANVSRFGTIFVPSGILVGRAIAGVGAFGPVTDPASMAEMFLLWNDVTNLLRNDDCELLRSNSAVSIKENYLPQYAVYTADPGVADPTVAETMTHSGTDGTLPVGAVYSGYTWLTTGGETKISPLASTTLLATEHLTFASRAFPTGVIGRRFYVGTEIGDQDVLFQGEQASAGAYNATTKGVGSRPPTRNNTSSALGRQLQEIRRLYKCIKGAN